MQRIIQKLPRLLVATMIVAGSFMPLTITAPVWAEEDCIANESDPNYSANPCPKGDASASGSCSDATNLGNCDLISRFINPAVNFLAVLFGLIVTISVVIGAIQYGSSAGDPQKASAAKARIRNAIIALVAFTLLYAGISYLIPGGLI